MRGPAINITTFPVERVLEEERLITSIRTRAASSFSSGDPFMRPSFSMARHGVIPCGVGRDGGRGETGWEEGRGETGWEEGRREGGREKGEETLKHRKREGKMAVTHTNLQSKPTQLLSYQDVCDSLQSLTEIANVVRQFLLVHTLHVHTHTHTQRERG